MESLRMIWPDAIITLIAALTLSVLFRLIPVRIQSIWTRFQTVQKPFVPQKFLTFRISNIPRRMAENDLWEILTKLPITAQGIGDRPTLLGYSYSPTAASSFAEKYAVATVTFEHAPALSELEMALKRGIGIDANQLKVDLDFLGITPLADGAIDCLFICLFYY
ncbi:hypothetical protein V8C37DRAFT_391325 [Trichoderma ceciliae]